MYLFSGVNMYTSKMQYHIDVQKIKFLEKREIFHAFYQSSVAARPVLCLT